MLWTIFVILLVLWLLGFFAFHVTSGFIHLILVVAVVVLPATSSTKVEAFELTFTNVPSSVAEPIPALPPQFSGESMYMMRGVVLAAT